MSQILDEKVLAMKDEMIEKIRESVCIDSVRGEAKPDAPYGEGPKAALDHALELGKKLGFKTGNNDNRVGWVEYGEGEEMVGVLGHLDVVPVGEGWDFPPFGAEIHDGKIYGRGVMDDKGPTIGAIYALKAIKDSGLPIDRRIRVMFGTDEECGSSCVRHYIESGQELPTIGFTPDADYPVIFAEKGMSKFVLGKKREKSPTDVVTSIEGGTASNVVIPVCRLNMKDGEKKTTAGKGAHGSTPQKGINAALKMMQEMKELKAEKDFCNLRDFILNYLEETNGKKLGIYYQDEEMGETTVNLGLLHYNETDMSITLDIRYPKNADPDAIYSQIQRIARDFELEVLDHHVTPHLYVSKDSELVQKLMKVYKEKTGRDEQPLSIGGGTYAKAFKNMVAFGPEFQGDPETIHQPNEFAEIDKLVQSVVIMAAGMYALAQK